MEYKGTKLITMEFAEPTDVNEEQDSGRRHPRSGVGNSTSVWLTPNGLADVMDALDFKHHEIFSSNANLRYQIGFFRNEPHKAVSDQLDFSQPLPMRLERGEAAEVSRKKDIEFLSRTAAEVFVVGDKSRLENCLNVLAGNNITVRETITLDGEVALSQEQLEYLMQQGENGQSVYIVLATSNVSEIYTQLMLANFASYVFSTFSL